MARLRKDDKLWPNVIKHLPYFIEIESKLKRTRNSDKADQEIEKLYRYFKSIASEFFEGDILQGGYRYLNHKLVACEALMPKTFITDTKPRYRYGMFSNEVPDTHDIKEKLDWIVYMTRRYLHIKYYSQQINFHQLDLTNQCLTASKKVKEYATQLNLDCKMVIIYPGFTKYPELYDGNGYHCINIITYDDKTYLIDCTYSQFFTLRGNNLERIGLLEMSGCLPGVFMLMNNERKRVADEILENGWIQATKGNLKRYLDGFAISYRNGLYYAKTEDYSYTTIYNADDYLEFMKRHDNQVNREGEELLGFQRTLTPKNKYKF